MTKDIKELVRQLRLAREPIRHTAADALEALAGEVERLTKTHEHAAANAARYLGLLNDAEAEVVRLRGGS